MKRSARGLKPTLKSAPKDAFKGLLYLYARAEPFERVFTHAMAQRHCRNSPSVVERNLFSTFKGGNGASRSRHS
jgi:hypothetical protein